MIRNRDEEFFHHNYDIVIGPVADAILDQEIFRFKREYPKTYLEDGPCGFLLTGSINLEAAIHSTASALTKQ